MISVSLQVADRRIFQLVLRNRAILSRPMTGASQTQPLIELEHIDKTYSDGQVQALRNICLHIHDGEFVSIMGPSGCGKSTLLNMIGALDRPTQGSVSIAGNRIEKNTNLDALRSSTIGFVFQSFYLLPNLTALENVQLPMFESDIDRPARPAAAQELLQLVGLSDRLHHRPNQLSIGQRQRVAIARALANTPKVLLADEPTGSLDSKSGSEIMELFQRLNAERGTTLIVVTHDEKVALCGSRIIRMLDGSILTDDSLNK
ncbi:MAG: ABC transporter ATP-binding protein [Aureliella sp.]